jgi:hypothetical protein
MSGDWTLSALAERCWGNSDPRAWSWFSKLVAALLALGALGYRADAYGRIYQAAARLARDYNIQSRGGGGNSSSSMPRNASAVARRCPKCGGRRPRAKEIKEKTVS